MSNFQKTIKALYNINLDAAVLLFYKGYEQWAREYFPGLWYNTVTTNIIKSFNTLFKHVEELSITMLVEFINDILQGH